MGKYRKKLQIIADILEISRNGTRKTRIMYQANLSYKLLCSYLVKVLEAGLVAGDDDDCYVLTPKGEKFLNEYKKYSRLCRRLENQLELIKSEKRALAKLCKSGEVGSVTVDLSAKDTGQEIPERKIRDV
ncbi:MAG: winged helix-turn-helix domain-containing protein [Candidatus Bathyarchaeota archaeon]|nr:winged helix-turn-helix domain-containing protein [Candidatus Bathyarchaeota archaeon]